MLADKGPLDDLKPESAHLNHPVWGEISPEFKSSEFEKPKLMDVHFLRLLHKARLLAGVPFRIIDSYRDDPRSAHGELPVAAVDLQVYNSYERSRIVRALYAVGFIRVGVYPGSDGELAGKHRRDKGGVHVDGSRTKPQDRMWTMKIRKTLAVLALLVGLAQPVAAQQDTVQVNVINRTDLQLIISPEGPLTVFTGDSLRFTAVAVDSVTGDTLQATFQWSSTDPSVISVDPQTGWARFLGRGMASVVVDLVDVVSLIFMSQDDQAAWVEVFNARRMPYYTAQGFVPDTLRMEVGQSRPMCVYAHDELDRVYLAVPLKDLRSANLEVATVTFDPMQTDCPAWGAFPLSPSIGSMARLAYARLIPS